MTRMIRVSAPLEQGTISKMQLLAVFLCALVPYTIGNGITPLLSVYATELGASRAVAGYCLSFCQLALATGTLGAGWLSDKPQHRKVLIMMGGMISIPAVWLAGRATSVWHLIAFLGAFFFCAGMTAPMISIVAGSLAGKGERGRTFGILSLAPSLGALIGGATAGPIADKWGYPTMYGALFSVTTWIGGVIGFAITGYAVQTLGMPTTFTLAALLPLTAIVLLIPVRETRHEEGSAPNSENSVA